MSEHAESDELSEHEALELRLLLDAMLLRYGYDFRDYARASLRRRIRKRMQDSGVDNLGEVIHRVIHQPEFFDRLLADLSINVTEMFRDPLFFRALREQVLPTLAARPVLKIWHAGCSTGEEVYSLAILLEECGLYDRATIIATDLNEAVLTRARDAIYPVDRVREFTAAYQASGGTGSFAEYYHADDGFARIRPRLKRNIVFAVHDLVVDASIGEMDMIVCRNVLIYFNRELQNRVIRIFAESLPIDGVLCLGAKESVRFSDSAPWFRGDEGGQRIYWRQEPDE
jgi:chemotaxis protein methyltransferase CheR